MQQKMSANVDRGAALMLMMVVEPSCAGFQESGTRKADESGEMKIRAFASGERQQKATVGARIYEEDARDSRAYRVSTVALTSKIKYLGTEVANTYLTLEERV